MINKTIFQGRLTRDPELRHTNSDIPVASFTIAWSEKYKETETKCFLPCTAWRGIGEFVNKYFVKGQEIIVSGKLQTREWVDKEGNNRSTIELTVDEAHFCGKKNEGRTESADVSASGTRSENLKEEGYEELGPDDSLPF